MVIQTNIKKTLTNLIHHFWIGSKNGYDATKATNYNLKLLLEKEGFYFNFYLFIFGEENKFLSKCRKAEFYTRNIKKKKLH